MCLNTKVSSPHSYDCRFCALFLCFLNFIYFIFYHQTICPLRRRGLLIYNSSENQNVYTIYNIKRVVGQVLQYILLYSLDISYCYHNILYYTGHCRIGRYQCDNLEL